MSNDDPNELQAALDQLTAEQDRRAAEKIEKGTAVRGTPTVVGGPESIGSVPTHDPDGRELVYGADDITHIITGVPRPEVDEKYYTRLMREREVPNKPLAALREEEPSRIPGPLLRTAPQTEKPPEPKRIFVQTRGCADYDDPGEIVEGYYDVKRGVLYVWGADSTSPIGQVAISPGDDVEHAARKLLREKSGKGRFNQPINYPKRYYH